MGVFKNQKGNYLHFPAFDREVRGQTTRVCLRAGGNLIREEPSSAFSLQQSMCLL